MSLWHKRASVSNIRISDHWIALLWSQDICGGSLVAATFVITAAHCVVRDYKENGMKKTLQKATDLMVWFSRVIHGHSPLNLVNFHLNEVIIIYLDDVYDILEHINYKYQKDIQTFSADCGNNQTAILTR